MYNTYNPVELKDYILTKLGAPITNIEVTEEQIYTCIQDALQLFGEYHYNGTNTGYYTFYVGDDDKYRNGVFELDANVFAITKIVRIDSAASMFTMDGTASYPWVNDFVMGLTGNGVIGGRSCGISPTSPLTQGALGYYYQIMTYYGMMKDILFPLPQYNYNDDTRQLKVTGTFKKGDIIVVEAMIASYVDVGNMVGNVGNMQIGSSYDPYATQSDIYNNPNAALQGVPIGGITDPAKQGSYNNRWVKEYAIELVRELNGTILFKHQGLKLAGGITVDGASIINRALARQEQLRQELDLLSPCVPILVG